jgi:AcrR family transcriptional regulator
MVAVPVACRQKQELDNADVPSVFYDIVSEFEGRSRRPRVEPRATKQIRKSDRTRAAILSAAFDFVWSHPFRDMTVQSLMAETGASRSAFYQYFDGRHELMESMLDILQHEILEAAAPWISGVGDPVALLREALAGLVRVCYDRGPFLRAVTDAAPTDKRIEEAWNDFLRRFDDASTARIQADQEQRLIPAFDARPVAVALNRLDASALIDSFGRRPRSRPEPVREALMRIWISTLYGAKWLASESSTLVRT